MQTWKDILWLLILLPLTILTPFMVAAIFKGFGIVCFAIFMPTTFLGWFKETILWPWAKHSRKQKPN